MRGLSHVQRYCSKTKNTPTGNAPMILACCHIVLLVVLFSISSFVEPPGQSSDSPEQTHLNVLASNADEELYLERLATTHNGLLHYRYNSSKFVLVNDSGETTDELSVAPNSTLSCPIKQVAVVKNKESVVIIITEDHFLLFDVKDNQLTPMCSCKHDLADNAMIPVALPAVYLYDEYLVAIPNSDEALVDLYTISAVNKKVEHVYSTTCNAEWNGLENLDLEMCVCYVVLSFPNENNSSTKLEIQSITFDPTKAGDPSSYHLVNKYFLPSCWQHVSLNAHGDIYFVSSGSNLQGLNFCWIDIDGKGNLALIDSTEIFNHTVASRSTSLSSDDYNTYICTSDLTGELLLVSIPDEIELEAATPVVLASQLGWHGVAATGLYHDFDTGVMRWKALCSDQESSFAPYKVLTGEFRDNNEKPIPGR